MFKRCLEFGKTQLLVLILPNFIGYVMRQFFSSLKSIIYKSREKMLEKSQKKRKKKKKRDFGVVVALIGSAHNDNGIIT